MFKFSGNIGLDFITIASFNDLPLFCSHYSRAQIHTFFVSRNAYNLARKSIGSNTPMNSYTSIPDVRTVYGAGLRVLSGTCSNLRENTVFCADNVISYIKTHGFGKYYSVIDAILAYQCLTFMSRVA